MAGFASAEWSRLPSTETTSVNLASQAILGTKLQSSTGMTNAVALLSDSVSAEAKLEAGKSEAVIALSEQLLIESLSFLNDGAAGKVSVASSADLKDWQALAQASFESTDRQVPVKFAGVQAKYVRLTFETKSATTIRNLKLKGPVASRDFTPVALENDKTIEVNLASDALGARPIYMFPTPAIDENAADREGQAFNFPKSKERYRTVVYDLGAVRSIKKFSAAYSRVPTRLEVFAFEQLPEKKDWRGKLTLDPVIFDAHKPVASVDDASGAGSAQVSAAQPVSAQYIVLRFEPNYNKRSVTGLNPDWKSIAFAVVAPSPFSFLAEQVTLFGTGKFVEASAEQEGAAFIAYGASAEGSVPLVLVSKTSIAHKQQQLGVGSSEVDAVNSILTSAGFTPLPQNATVMNKNKPKAAQLAAAGGTGGPSGVNSLGLSAYKAGAGAVDANESTLPTAPGEATQNGGAKAAPTSGVNAASGPVTIAPTSN